jgi:hypothetical protein
MRYNVFMTELTIMANIAQECQDEQEREEGWKTTKEGWKQEWE